MEIRIRPTPENVINLLQHLQSTKTPFDVIDEQALADTLAYEIHNPKLTPQLLLSLGIFDVIELFPQGEPYDAFRSLAMKIQNLPPETALRKPTAAFKQFCGAEWLTSDGRITRAGAINCIQNYIRSRGLDSSYTVTLNDTLKTALSTSSDQVPSYMLETLVESVFTE